MLSLSDLAILVAILLSVTGAARILYVNRRWRDRRFIGLHRAAGPLHGTVVDAGGMEAPLLRFTAGGRPAMVEFEPGTSRPPASGC